jgi:hypothetical protein
MKIVVCQNCNEKLMLMKCRCGREFVWKPNSSIDLNSKSNLLTGRILMKCSFCVNKDLGDLGMAITESLNMRNCPKCGEVVV